MLHRLSLATCLTLASPPALAAPALKVTFTDWLTSGSHARRYTLALPPGDQATVLHAIDDGGRHGGHSTVRVRLVLRRDRDQSLLEYEVRRDVVGGSGDGGARPAQLDLRGAVTVPGRGAITIGEVSPSTAGGGARVDVELVR